MKIALFAYSRQGCRTARAVMSLFSQDDIRAHTMERFEEKGFDPIRRPAKSFYGELFFKPFHGVSSDIILRKERHDCTSRAAPLAAISK